MFGVVVTVNIAPGQFETARKALQEQVIPRVRQAPGLVKGYWTVRPGAGEGLSLVVFDTREHADGAANMVRTSPPPAGVTLSTVEVREIVAET